MKKHVLEALHNRFEGVSSAILERVAEKLSKTVNTEGEIATAVDGVSIQQIIEAYGDSRANEAQQTAIRNYESKYGLKNGIKAEGALAKASDTLPPETGVVKASSATDADTDTPAWAKSLLEQNKMLSERLSGIEKEKTVSKRRESLGGIINKLPENLRAAYARTPIETLTDEEFETVHSEISNEVESIVREHNARGAVFGRPLSGGVLKPLGATRLANEASEAEAEAVVEKMNI